MALSVNKGILLVILCCRLLWPAVCAGDVKTRTPALLNSLHELWSFYKYTYIQGGRVVSLDEKGITTSEGQGYALLRAVWANDHVAFKQVYQWTRENLMIRGDHLAAWKWKQDRNAATDADTDIALALLMGAKKFSHKSYHDDALLIINDIWEQEVIHVQDRYYLTAGNWAVKEAYPTIHVAYLAPYAYELFAEVDKQHPWRELITSSYEILEWIFLENKCPLPPEIIYVNKADGKLSFTTPANKHKSDFSYDAFPLYWRLAMDREWHGRNKAELISKMLEFWRSEWNKHRNFYDRYTIAGEAKSKFEALPLYATVHSLALAVDLDWAQAIFDQKLSPLWEKALAGKDTPYYLHNWLWFDRALHAKVARNLTDFFDFLKPFDFRSFFACFPRELMAACLVFFVLARFEVMNFDLLFRSAFLVCGFGLCFRYLHWRVTSSLNFLEPLGPFISMSLWGAEFYCFSTVLLLLLQVGLKARPRQKPQTLSDFEPSVDVFIPIYSEGLDILEKTLAAACAMDYANKTVFVLDDSHRDSVRELALAYGGRYIKGPKKHAKAGNLNHALTQTQGELVVVFDTDHIPVAGFLSETVPFFSNPKMGVVQTPHHFYNPDIFQRAFQCEEKIPNEQDMFNHGIQGGRDGWKGAFFVGSGAVFRREAIQRIGGFKLMSITEDIHSSQHIHAVGYESAFVDKDLAVGLTAENYSSYIIQRRRWMQGCLQIFFRNNPLFQKGLGLRQRLGYFASLYYFFFPIIRIIFWITPLYYLFFHLHPIFADVSVLLGYMLPYLICLPLLSAALLPKWPRMFWGVIYENAVCFPLFLSMLAMFLPKKLGFKVTPKGIVSDKRRFDFSTAAVTLLMALVNAAAVIKGLAEFYYFDIEKDAYFFNLAWAAYNLLILLAALLVAWERPQQRCADRLKISVPFILRAGKWWLKGRTEDISLTGLSFRPQPGVVIPASATLELFAEKPLFIPVRLVYQDRRLGKGRRCGLRFDSNEVSVQNELLLRTFALPATWEKAHAAHTRSNLIMGYYFIRGIFSCFSSSWPLKRSEIRYKKLSFRHLTADGKKIPAILVNSSEKGRKFIALTFAVNPQDAWGILDSSGKSVAAQVIHAKRILPFAFRMGMRLMKT